MENILEAKASLRDNKGSARKARLVLDMIRGKAVNEAKNILQFSNKKVAKDIHKLLNSAIANATQVAGKADTTNMTINKAYADEGRIDKRTLLRYRGTADRILKRRCHITIGVILKK